MMTYVYAAMDRMDKPRQGDVRGVIALAQVDPQRQRPLPAERDIRRIALCRSRVFKRVMEGEEELSAAPQIRFWLPRNYRRLPLTAGLS